VPVAIKVGSLWLIPVKHAHCPFRAMRFLLPSETLSVKSHTKNRLVQVPHRFTITYSKIADRPFFMRRCTRLQRPCKCIVRANSPNVYASRKGPLWYTAFAPRGAFSIKFSRVWRGLLSFVASTSAVVVAPICVPCVSVSNENLLSLAVSAHSASHGA